VDGSRVTWDWRGEEQFAARQVGSRNATSPFPVHHTILAVRNRYLGCLNRGGESVGGMAPFASLSLPMFCAKACYAVLDRRRRRWSTIQPGRSEVWNGSIMKGISEREVVLQANQARSDDDVVRSEQFVDRCSVPSNPVWPGARSGSCHAASRKSTKSSIRSLRRR
jgi:hypothetical protein